MKNAEVVVEEEADTAKINIGCKVGVLDMVDEEETELFIIGSTEATRIKE